MPAKKVVAARDMNPLFLKGQSPLCAKQHD
jgi:hypothetical protein